jgi:hypothetical protein
VRDLEDLLATPPSSASSRTTITGDDGEALPASKRAAAAERAFFGVPPDFLGVAGADRRAAVQKGAKSSSGSTVTGVSTLHSGTDSALEDLPPLLVLLPHPATAATAAAAAAAGRSPSGRPCSPRSAEPTSGFEGSLIGEPAAEGRATPCH